MTKTQTESLRVKEGRTELSTKGRTFIHPAYRGTFAQLGEAINADGLQRPTMADTADLVHTAYNSNDKYSNEIKGIMKDGFFYVFNGNLYIPNRGVYIQDNPQLTNGRVFMDSSELERKIEAKDPSVRFVPFGFKTGEMTPMELGRNSFVIGLAGEEGAEKLAEVADTYKRRPYLYSFESVDEPITRVSALIDDWGVDLGLGVDGDNGGDYRDGRAFGVRNVGAKK
jgi:hypothetical protein